MSHSQRFTELLAAMRAELGAAIQEVSSMTDVNQAGTCRIRIRRLYAEIDRLANAAGPALVFVDGCRAKAHKGQGKLFS